MRLVKMLIMYRLPMKKPLTHSKELAKHEGIIPALKAHSLGLCLEID